ncbi:MULTISPECIES: cytochrome b [Streptomyces]|jgi:ubiquinol-cytochrome c reductase cytochrome b subunit|uniref:cytochrome bc1 complex cytochrome b subunit n=1 Tax=unclassified Streptomyces TaxID=2593676 RepID=UPI0008915EF5|nr:MULTISPECIES: ubiquinol-cytochrome c reductase cytochrome b subunit [unclassified Streptomyces]MDX2733290.1 ubiquinol-cytochrome c reductase cytochrome b subunit [Streptomyces sp. PA03-2a]MDX3770131.1 ubiquinol-cytochrome c reductase cytochrome b subunit [Streptomyces sp. AK08-01B]MDX3819402.1 ubiquinol-cytochrome c reductase cytochrome b subunit [Streptomyces sp. AK08-01A]SCZ11879.1 menaquinol-cytochrome c reductase cytochrome b subunit precursor [Streptomyces sp. 136MFCol5.1]SFT25439.1 ub
MPLRKRKAQLKTRAGKAAVDGYGAMDARLPVSELAKQLVRKAFPDHWSFLLGEIALYSFVVLLLTGVYLTLFFDPSMTESVYTGSYAPLQGVRMTQAYTTTLAISFDVRGGLLIRQIHHWAALVFVAAISVHLLRIFFTGAFRKPREANWIVGVTLFVLALLEGFAGYSLPDDLLSGTGLRTAATIVGSIPVVGTYVEMFVFGGQFPGNDVIPRLYAVHILLVPGLIVALITAHLMLVAYLKHTHWAGQGRTNRNAVGSPAFPQFTAKTTGFLLMVFGVLALLGGLAQINPVWNYGPYRADQVSGDAQPDWYVGFLEGALRLMPPWETDIAGHTVMWNVFIPTLVLPGVVFTLLFLYPFFERWVTGDRGEHHLCDRPRNRPTRTGLGVAAIVFYAVLLVAGGNDVVAFSFRVSIEVMTWILRIALVVAPLLAFALTKRLCLALQMRDRRRLTEGEETGQVTQSVNGDLAESHRGLSPTARYRILMRDVPTPLELPTEGPVSRRRRVRTALSGWYYRDFVELPATDEQRSRIAERTAPPDPVRGPED